MLDEKEVIILLKNSLHNFIKSLENNSLNYVEYEAEAKTYMKVLNNSDLSARSLSIKNAKELLDKLKI